MERPNNVYDCPTCGFNGEMTLRTRILDYENMPNYKYWVYYCPMCGERFTTTESDNISFENWKRKNREEKLERILR
jgi:predicted RNA-binding Zn-ribbon protein involved in translation (DUF1610 family)